MFLFHFFSLSLSRGRVEEKKKNLFFLNLYFYAKKIEILLYIFHYH